MSNLPQYNVNNSHQLIKRQNTFVLERKIVTIHSEDRDITKWPESNIFEIDLPDSLSNIQSMRLIDIILPSNFLVFSNNYKNTKLEFYINPSLSTNIAEYLKLQTNINNSYTITIQEGSYTPEQFALEIENLMNKEVTLFLQTTIPDASYNRFKVHYDIVSNNMWFGNTFDKFIFMFNQKIIYNIPCSSNNNQYDIDVWSNYSNWGLPYNMGFNKEIYTSIITNDNITFNYNNYTWLKPNEDDLPNGEEAHAYYIKSPNMACILGDSVIYMEMNKYNSIDELVPYSENTNNLYNNDYNGTVNSSFAKIPIIKNMDNQIVYTSNDYLQNVSQYQPTIDKIKKLKFIFRYHDGRLVNFNNCNFNFSIAFNKLKNEIARDYEVRIPHEYTF